MTNAKNAEPTTEATNEEGKIDAVISNGEGTIEVFFGDGDATPHTILFSKLESGIIQATVDGKTGGAKSKGVAVSNALGMLYTKGFNFKANTQNAVYGELVPVKRNEPPVKDDLTEAQAQGMSEFTDTINSGWDELGKAEKVTRVATRSIGMAIHSAREFLNASVAVEKDDPNAVASNKRWGQYTEHFAVFKSNKNALSEFTVVGNMSVALFDEIPDGKDSAKSIGAWINERTAELALSCATIIARENETATSSKGHELMVSTLNETATSDTEAPSLRVLAKETLETIDGLTMVEFEKTKFGKAMTKAMKAQAAARVTDEQKAEAATEKAVEVITTAFGDMDIVAATEHVATIMFAHSECFDIYENLKDILNAKADALEAAEAEAAEEDADGDLD